MALKLSNNAVSTLAASITAAATTISVQSGDAGKFPVLGAGDWCPATIIDSANNMEIVRVTARAAGTLTIVRAQEGTTAKAFAAGSRVDVRLTSAVIAELISLNKTLTTTVDNNATATSTALGEKAPLSSPAFTDNPTTPTPPVGDADLTIPNTGWVAQEIATAVGAIREKFSQKSANYTAVKTDNATSFMYTAAATLALTAAATLTTNWWCEVWAVGGNVAIDPYGSETIDGKATVIVQPGQMARVFCTGTAFFTEIVGDPLQGPQNQGFSVGLNLSTNATDAANDVDISAGSAAGDTSPFALMQLATGLTKRIDAAWAVGNNNGGLDTGTVAANGTYYLWLIQRSDTLVTDAVFSLSQTAPTMPANYDRKRLLPFSISRVASVNSEPLPTNRTTQRTDALVSLSGAAFDFTGIPADVNKITLIIGPLTTSANTNLLIQLGTPAGIDTSTNYNGTGGSVTSSSGSTQFTTGFRIGAGGGATTFYSHYIVLERFSGNTWVLSAGASDNQGRSLKADGSITLSAALTQLRVTTVSGTATITGSMRVKMEK